MPNTEVVALLHDLYLRFPISTLAIVAGVSPGTITTTILRGELPCRRRARERLVAFVKLNGQARCRADLKVVA